jgi:hypothetical protein
MKGPVGLQLQSAEDDKDGGAAVAAASLDVCADEMDVECGMLTAEEVEAPGKIEVGADGG